MNIQLALLATVTISVAGASAIPTASESVNDSNLDAECIVTNFNNVEAACAKCSNLVISGLTVPAGKTLNLNLRTGAQLTFKGHINFGFKNWGGPLMLISGSHITVKGEAGHVLNGEGQLYWDGKGGAGSTKPLLIHIRASDKSVIEDINVLNCPERCVSVHGSDITINKWNIDVSLGNKKGGHNTDGFDVQGKNLVFTNCVVKNQDDCVAINSGSDMTFSNFECHGTHGLSLSIGLGSSGGEENSAKNIVFENSKVINSDNGIHIKTHPKGATGLISNLVYRNIELSGIRKYGISIEQDYADKGHLRANIPIKNLTITNVRGTMSNSEGKNVYIACASGGCSDWHWSGVKITGATDECNYKPIGFTC